MLQEYTQEIKHVITDAGITRIKDTATPEETYYLIHDT